MKTLLFPTLLLLLLAACENEDIKTSEEENSTEGTEIVIDDTDFETTDWTTETHSNDADPDFGVVFEENTVQRLDIVIVSDHWDAMLEDMTNLYGTLGSSRGGGGNSFADENPIFVPAEVFHDGKQWYKVGVRFKGNSSLSSTWSSGNLKLSFKLDFDEFEDEYPQIKNQRFYGFKKLSLKNNFNDKSFLREKVAADIFRNAGLASSHAAFYTVYVDHGDGPIYFGLYTLVEEVDDTVIDTQFADNDGNLYQPDGDGASFASGTFDESEFVKETNEDAADWSDIQNLFTALHASSRTSDPAAWRADLETVLDTDIFLKYLAVNTVIQNWDTYGRMTHNYFLYNNPDNNLLTWIPWDNNEAFQTGNGQGSLPLNFSGLSSSQWPLIGYLYADATYKNQYDTYVAEAISGVFEASSIQATYTNYATLIESYATSETRGYTFLNSTSEFQSAINTLKSHATQRTAAVKAYLE
ncbi:CotH kinase family protein [Reichenbachiella agarivorans]|uniref:CotH kinase family protein n=1 Tax=Reichenbachiella agarivorans TaxID=2979464 RepID=A0ABY6CM51_9BACT|nr:CotH kinase family protein [Reichenbachiella agarivorans]UXP31593.1 CotH kinase family protein [Reichenbachiella agarivorans]